VPVRDAQTILGQTRISTTLEIYTGSGNPAQRDALSGLHDLLDEAQVELGDSAAGPSGFFDGTLGCPNIGADQAEGCYGIQPDIVARLAVIPVGHTTLLAWARTSKASPDEAFFAMFERMLKSVRFR